MRQQRFCFGVGFCSCANHDVHAPVFIDLVEIDLRKNYVFFQTKRIIAVAVKTLDRNTTKVTNAGHRDSCQPIHKFKHPNATKRYLSAQRHILAHPKTRDGFFSFRHNGVLARDQRQILLGRFGFFGITNCSGAAANINDNFV